MVPKSASGGSAGGPGRTWPSSCCQNPGGSRASGRRRVRSSSSIQPEPDFSGQARRHAPAQVIPGRVTGPWFLWRTGTLKPCTSSIVSPKKKFPAKVGAGMSERAAGNTTLQRPASVSAQQVWRLWRGKWRGPRWITSKARLLLSLPASFFFFFFVSVLLVSFCVFPWQRWGKVVFPCVWSVVVVWWQTFLRRLLGTAHAELRSKFCRFKVCFLCLKTYPL